MTMPRQGRIAVAHARLYFRDVGRGRAIIVLHGGPDFDHRYLLPDLDRLCDVFRLIYYDQRGRGLSAQGVLPEDVTLESDVADIDAVRRHFDLPAAVLLGHSWGGVLALEYAIRHPERVSHLVLMNPAPASSADFQLLAKRAREAAGRDRLEAIAATPAYEQGDPDAVAAYYRIHFEPALARREDLDRIIATFRATFTREGILKARAIEDRLMDETWRSAGYDLLPALARLTMPTLLTYGEPEIIPRACVAHIADAMPNARMVTLQRCGHFPYLERPDEVGREIRAFLDA
ncbi:MAG TPA: alpha/beta fold hydrolase [Casimicrobiaceae bacterium]|jgi:proline iminopeptidase